MFPLSGLRLIAVEQYGAGPMRGPYAAFALVSAVLSARATG